MKKLMIALSAVVLGVTSANADFLWNWWTTSNEGFNYIEAHSIKIGKPLKDMSLAEMDKLWEEAKEIEVRGER